MGVGQTHGRGGGAELEEGDLGVSSAAPSQGLEPTLL